MRLPIARGIQRVAQTSKSAASAISKSAGFTLMEIMIVVGIIGLIAAMGMPSIMSALQKSGMRKAVSDVQDVFFSAREQAIIHNKPVAVIIYPREGRFGVEGSAAGEAGSTTVNVHSGRTLVATLPDGITFYAIGIYRKDYTESDWAKIYFNPDGTSDEAVILLSGNGGAESEKITLEYATGVPVLSKADQ